MRFLKTKKGLALLVAVVAVAASAVGAYAYFSTSGSGTGSFSTGALWLDQVTSETVGPLYRRRIRRRCACTVHVANNGGGTQYVGQITGMVDASSAVGCDPSWFTVAPISAPGRLTPGSHDFGSSIILNDLNGNQDACASASLTIDWTSASG